MDRTVKILVADLMHQANSDNVNLTIKRVDNEGYVINNDKKDRVVAVGLLNIKNEYDEEEYVVGAFTIDVSKFKWAEAEGFTMDQMIDEEALAGKIFNLIAVDDVLDYLTYKK